MHALNAIKAKRSGVECVVSRERGGRHRLRLRNIAVKCQDAKAHNRYVQWASDDYRRHSELKHTSTAVVITLESVGHA